LHFRYYPGAFVFPGGRRDETDIDIRTTAWREVKEEIGVDIDPARLVPLRNINTSAHAGPVYHMLTFAYHVEGEFVTNPNSDEIEEEVWVEARQAIEVYDLPYQIRAAVYTIARFATVNDLLQALGSGSIDEDYWI